MEEVSDVSFNGLEGGIGYLGVSFTSPVLWISLGRENGCEGSIDLGDTAFGLNGIMPAFLKPANPYSFYIHFSRPLLTSKGNPIWLPLIAAPL